MLENKAHLKILTLSEEEREKLAESIKASIEKIMGTQQTQITKYKLDLLNYLQSMNSEKISYYLESVHKVLRKAESFHETYGHFYGDVANKESDEVILCYLLLPKYAATWLDKEYFQDFLCHHSTYQNDLLNKFFLEIESK